MEFKYQKCVSILLVAILLTSLVGSSRGQAFGLQQSCTCPLDKCCLPQGQCGDCCPGELHNLTDFVHELIEYRSDLIKLKCDYNGLTGTIPTEVGRLEKLTEIRFHGNDLHGTVPTEIRQLQHLFTLILGENQLTGPLPLFSAQQSVRFFQIERNQITGTIPSEYGLMYLKSFHGFFNKLTGSIPTELGNAPLQYLRVHHNQLSGTIPSELGRTIGYEFQLDNNRFTGTIPTQLAEMNNLMRLHVSNNFLTGTIPEEITKMGRLTSLRLYNENMERLICDSDALSWYSNVAQVIDDRNQILCRNDSVYGEIDLTPHILRIEPEAPEKYPLLLSEETIKTTQSILVKWSYNGTVPNGNVSPAIRSIIRNCERSSLAISNNNTFTKMLGFEISWNNNRVCILSDELHESDNFGYNITDMNPSTEYEISIQPFYLDAEQNKVKIIFGIQSYSLIVQTNDDKPEAGPSNIRLTFRADDSIDLKWDSIPRELSNGKITGYTVECERCPRNTYTTNSNYISIGQLTPESEYTFYISPKTIAGHGPPSFATFKLCAQNTYSYDYSDESCNLAKSGYFFSASEYGSFACSLFSDEIVQETCLGGGVNVSMVTLQTGYWRPNINSMAGLKLCPNPLFCTSQQTGAYANVQELCAPHHEGVFCSKCSDDYILSSSGCVKCDTNAKNEAVQRAVAYGVAVALFGIIYLFIAAYSAGLFKMQQTAMEGLKHKIDQMGRFFVRHVSTKIEILIITTQILFSFQNSMSTKSASSVSDNFFTALLALELESLIPALGLHCFMDTTFYQKLLFATLLPLAFMIFIWLMYCVIRNFVKEVGKLYRKVFSLFLLVGFYVYAPVTRTIIRTFLCETIPFESGDEEYLRADYRISCASEEYELYLIYAVWMLILYPVGFFCMYTYLLHTRRPLFVERMRTKNIGISDEQKLKSVQVLTRPYRDDCYWFGIYELVRRLMLTALLPVIDAQEETRRTMHVAEVYAFILVVLSIVVLEVIRPYKYKVDWLYSLVSLILLALASQAGLWSHLANRNESIVMKAEYEENFYLMLFWMQLFLFFLFIVADVMIENKKADENGKKDKQDDYSFEFENDSSIYGTSQKEMDMTTFSFYKPRNN